MRGQVEMLEHFGKRVARSQDELFEDRPVLRSARKKWLAVEPEPARGRRGPAAFGLTPALAYATLGAVLGLAAVGTHAWLTRPLSYEVEGLQVKVESSQSIVRSEGTHGSLRFSDGTLVRLGEGTEASVSHVERTGAHVSIQRGGVDASVVHREDSRWRFGFGPFEVRVIGTKFTGNWQPSSDGFRFSLTEGEVAIVGCGMSPLVLRTGQRLEGVCVDGRSTIHVYAKDSVASAASAGHRHAELRDKPKEPSLETPPGPASARKHGIAAPQGGDADPAAPKSEQDDVPSSRTSAREGNYREALDAVDRVGFEATCETADAAALLTLADVALFGGRTAHASFALLRIRTKHPGTSASATAAFKLGRLAFDQQGDMAQAGSWFHVYLQESPGGTFAREAHGRLMEVQRRMGNMDAARELAQRYLQQYPTGAHAGLARSLLAQPAQP